MCDQHSVKKIMFVYLKAYIQIWLEMAQWYLKIESLNFVNDLGPKSRNDLDLLLLYSHTLMDSIGCFASTNFQAISCNSF